MGYTNSLDLKENDILEFMDFFHNNFYLSVQTIHIYTHSQNMLAHGETMLNVYSI